MESARDPGFDKHFNKISQLERQLEAAYQQTAAYYKDPKNHNPGDFETYAKKIQNYDLGEMENSTRLQFFLTQKQNTVSVYEQNLKRLRSERDLGKKY